MRVEIIPGGLNRAELIATYKKSGKGEPMIDMGGWAYYPDDIAEFARGLLQLVIETRRGDNNE